ncbi:hypothetical protein L915_11896, partial [Phytophthora nicotianae]
DSHQRLDPGDVRQEVSSLEKLLRRIRIPHLDRSTAAGTASKNRRALADK